MDAVWTIDERWIKAEVERAAAIARRDAHLRQKYGTADRDAVREIRLAARGAHRKKAGAAPGAPAGKGKGKGVKVDRMKRERMADHARRHGKA
jgi:hypothetical protein